MIFGLSKSYIVVSKTTPEVKLGESFEEVNPGLYVQSFTQGDEVFVYCASEGKKQKEKSIIAKARNKMEEALNKISTVLETNKRPQKYDAVMQRIGRLRERYIRVSKGFEIAVTNADGLATALSWAFDQQKLGKPYDGSYFLRTNRTDLSVDKLVEIYFMLTTVKESFRCLKSELGLRPIHHRKDGRIDGHLFISVLAYHLLNYISYKCRKANIHHHWSTLRDRLRTHVLITTTLTKQDGGIVALRHCSTPGSEEAAIYSALGISSTPLKMVKTENGCSVKKGRLR